MVRAIPYVGDAGNGARLLARYRNLGEGTKSEYAPDSAGWCEARALGGGGTRGASGSIQAAGGGGAYARSGFFVSPGDTVATITVPRRTDSNSTGGDATVTLNGVTKVLAKGGAPGSGGTPGAGGQAAACTGDIKRSGGVGGAPNISIATSSGANGLGGPGASPATSATQAVGGSSAGDFIDADSLAAGSFGGFKGGQQLAAGPGGGGSGISTSGPEKDGGESLTWIEFWTSNPNL